MKRILIAILCVMILCGCSSNDKKNEDMSSESSNPTVSYTLNDVTKELVGKWQSHSIDWYIVVGEDGTYTWYIDDEGKVMDLTYSSYLESFTEYQPAIQHDPEFSDDYGVHIVSVKDRGDMLVGQDEGGNYKFYFWGQKWSRAEE